MTNLESIEMVYDKFEYPIKIYSDDPTQPPKIALVNEVVCDNEQARLEILDHYQEIREKAIVRVNKHFEFINREWQHAPWQINRYLKEKKLIKSLNLNSF